MAQICLKQTTKQNKTETPQHMILLVTSKQSVIDSFPHFYSVFFFSNYVAGDLKY